ncbi:hypothetical protein Lal_00039294 [Lupinus albus]|nr:hypothetical protein Lal_00039294 [Lupinus albus]
MMFEDNLKANEVATPKSISPRDFGPQRNHMQGRGKERVEDDRKPYAAPIGHRDRNFQRSRPPTVPTGGVSTPMCNKCGRLHYGSKCLGSGNNVSTTRSQGTLKGFNPGEGLENIGNARYSGGVHQLSALNVVPTKVISVSCPSVIAIVVSPGQEKWHSGPVEAVRSSVEREDPRLSESGLA